MKTRLGQAALWLTAKEIDEANLEAVHLNVAREDISYFNLSSNPIISVRHDGKLFYFRECPKRQKREAYFREAADRFFETLDHLGIDRAHFRQELPLRLDFTQPEREQFRAYIDRKRNDNRFLQEMAKAHIISAARGFSIWEEQRYDKAFFASFGMTELEEGLRDIAVYFLWCMRSAAANYARQNIARGKIYAFFNAVRSVASRIVAEEMGLAHLVTEAHWCVLHLGKGRELFGLLSPAAEGMRMLDASPALHGSLQRELINLNVLDVICHQPDHGPNNYDVWETNGHDGVCAFDQDNPRTFFPMPTICSPLAGCSPLVDGRGKLCRPYLDRETVERLALLDIRRLQTRLQPYLNPLQRWALAGRIKRLQRAFAAAKETTPGLLLDHSAWSDETARQEVEGGYGVTYLGKAWKGSDDRCGGS